MDHDRYCRQIYSRSGSNFRLAFAFLGKTRRQALTALYAFCRVVDDIVDECSDPGVASAKIEWWRSEIGQLYAGTPTHPITQSLATGVRKYDLPEEWFLEILDGMQMDLCYNRYLDFKQLQLYCYRVASVVGYLSAMIFGLEDRKTLRYAHDLGLALQLTNILRDVGDDARRGRIYLPAEDLQRFEVSEADILERRKSAGFDALMAFEIERAESYYQNAWNTLPAIDRKKQKPGLIMGAVYHALLTAIAEEPGLVLSHRISIPPGRKMIIACKTWLKSG